MPRNLIGYFNGGSDCRQYSVKIIANPTSNTFEEIYLAGESPFVVTYDVSNTPFDPIRTSRASITVVADNKLLDVFSSDAQGTQVILENGNSIEWVGYLTPNLLNMPDDLCGYDTFTLEAQDCIYTLDKLYYNTIGEKKSIVTFRQILGQIAERCGLLNEMYIDSSMMRPNGSYIEMGSLTISEQNFFYSDTDNSWTLKQVLEEICRYLGYTAMQYKDSLYLYDMQSHSEFTWQTDRDATMIMNGFKYQKSTNWNSYYQGSYPFSRGITLRQDIVRGTGADISLETIYNKVQVKDSFYEIDHFIPDFYDDTLLKNRYGEFWNCKSMVNSGKLRYISKSGTSKKEEKDENEHVYYIRKFNHQDYTPIYRDPITLEVADTTESKIIPVSVRNNQVNNDYTTYTGKYTVTGEFRNDDTVSHRVTVKATLTYEWYDGDILSWDSATNTQSSFITIQPGETKEITVEVETPHHERYDSSAKYDAVYRIDNYTDEYPLNIFADATSKFVGATITDLATFDKPMDNTKYNYETEANINFDRYIMIHQCDKPDRMHPYGEWIFLNPLHVLRDDQIESEFPAIMKLNEGYVNPMIIDSKAYLSIDASAIFERYNLEYINPDWTKDNSNINGLGLFLRTSSVTTIAPCLIFKLKIGNKYWSGQSGWTTTDSCFVVDLGTDKTDKDDADFTKWWNTEHPVLNNVSWTDWAGAKGYKIPLDETLDFGDDIGFWIMLPSKMQKVDTVNQYDGMNNFCWVQDLDVSFHTKEQLNYNLSDVLYENIIDSGSTNTLSDITCKITTYPGDGAHSYSSVGLDGALLKGMKKVGTDGVMNVPEENILKAYVNQYSTPTIKQTMTLQTYINPFSYIMDPTLDDRRFCILGTTIDYKKDSQTLTLCEVKSWHMN